MTLQNFQKSREAMVVSQLQPSGIVSEVVIEAYRGLPREMFVPNALRGVCYLDDDIDLGGGRILVEPLIFARMLQDAELLSSDKVLDIGGATGYSAALAAKLARHVVAVDADEKLLQQGQMQWQELGLLNITPVIGCHNDGYRAGGSYNVIFVNGAVSAMPEKLLDQLAYGGRLYFVEQKEEDTSGRLMVVVKDHSGVFLTKHLSDVTTSYLKGFEPAQSFVF